MTVELPAVAPLPFSIVVNGDERPLPDGGTVSDLLTSMSLPFARVAVEVNRQIVPKAEWNRSLSVGDRVEIVAFVGGG